MSDLFAGACVRRSRTILLALVAGTTGALPTFASAQLSLSPVSPRGQSVTPAFEGWYRNPDGTYSLSFGYFNRNTAEVVDIPLGPDNSISPGAASQGQPTRFYPRRHWGVFAVVVPADFGKQKVTWTLTVRGKTFAIPGSLNPDWQIDALEGEASADNTPPVLSFDADSPLARGPLGVTVGPRAARVGKPLTLTVTAKDDGKSLSPPGTPVELTWFVHQGQGDVSFVPSSSKLTPTGGTAATSVTFSAPGDYILRARANDSPVIGAGHSQCCWTNAFVRVTVSP